MQRTISTLVLACMIACGETVSTDGSDNIDAAVGDVAAGGSGGGSSDGFTGVEVRSSAGGPADGSVADEPIGGAAGDPAGSSAGGTADGSAGGPADGSAGASGGAADGSSAAESMAVEVDAAEGSDGGSAGESSGAISFAMAIAPILKAKCAECHERAWENTATAYARMLGTSAPDSACADMARITVGNGATSLVVTKMRGTATCGDRMPRIRTGPNMSVDCSGDQCVSDSDIDTISAWIDQGALNN